MVWRKAWALLALAISSHYGPTQAADTADGRKLFKQHCAACHTIRTGARAGFGPNLAGVVGRAAGGTDFDYSDALRASGIVWNQDALERWIADPKAFVPGTAMKFKGLHDPDERRAVIAHLMRAGGP